MVKAIICFIFMAINFNGEEVANEQGKIFINGSSYRLEIEDELLIVCDGSVQWIYRPQTDDIVITNHIVGESLTGIADALESKSSEQDIRRILSMFVGEAGINSQTEIIKDSNGRVKEIKACLDDSSCIKIKLTSVTEAEEFPNGYFTLNIADYPNAIVTDMR